MKPKSQTIVEMIKRLTIVVTAIITFMGFVNGIDIMKATGFLYGLDKMCNAAVLSLIIWILYLFITQTIYNTDHNIREKEETSETNSIEDESK